jgi:hypothetical protein
MEEFTCQYCSKSFLNKYILQRHIKEALYCIKTRDLDKLFECEHCFDSFSSQTKLLKHFNECKDKIIFEQQEQIIEGQKEVKNFKKLILKNAKKLLSQEERIIELENLLKKEKKSSESLKYDLAEKKGYIKGADKAIITNNKTCNTIKNITNIKLDSISIKNIKPLTIALVKENLKKYTYESFLAGKKGILRFIESIVILKNEDGKKELNYACTDSSRNKYHRLMETNKWGSDQGGVFINTILDEIKPPALDYYAKYSKEDVKKYSIDNDMFIGIINADEDRAKLVKELKNLINPLISV